MNAPFTTFEDNALIKLALAGNSDCFAILMDRHLTPVRRRIGSMVGNWADRDDLLQEVFIKVWLHLSTFRSESSFRTWITRVAMNEALQFYRRQQKRPAQPFCNLDSFASSCESQHHSLARTEESEAVRRAIVGLPAKYRQVLVLREFEHRSTKETAQSLRSTIPTVKTRVHRARIMLLSALRREGIGSC